MVQSNLTLLVQQTKIAMQNLGYSDETMRMANVIFNEFTEYASNGELPICGIMVSVYKWGVIHNKSSI